MPFVVNGVSASIYVGEDGESGGIVESWPESGPVATVHFKVPWAERHKLMQALAGPVITVGGLTRRVPFAYPDSPNLYCMEIGQTRGLKYRTREDGWGSYESAVFPATFKVPAWQFEAGDPGDPNRDASGQPWTTTKIKTSGEVLSVPGGTYLWVAGPDAGKPVEESQLGIVRPKVEIEMTRHWMPWIPLAAIRAAVGKLNESPITIGDQVFAKGELLFAGANTSVDTDTMGNVVQEVGYTLLGQDSDWNTLIARDSSYRLVSTNGTTSGTTPFAYADWWATLP